ncbi:acetate/propionate family kinase [Alienimonas californiensis]|uniref:Acetate kinase n=1 Tax=Alienimonas californiensis TaxID=2527989 RepID=A0A517P8S3_9PLAN|nr:acetate kinase [Alienimonas californiensis]QDT15767.1 Acetate kinase [Alienimonas californiensis]
MTASVLVLNAGSSSLKWDLFAAPAFSSLRSGMIERIGEKGGALDHAAALAAVLDELGEARPAVVGHRIVHGGRTFTGPALLDEAAIAEVERLVPLAPLHNPPALAGIRAVAERLPNVPQVGVFDTAFHQTMPEAAARYALPAWCEREHGVRRYGFHGTSHQYVSRVAGDYLQRTDGRDPVELNLVTLHLGNGCSAAAVAGGVCVDTSMGLTPLEGLVMGTRCGDLDPAAVTYLQRAAGLSAEEVDRLLNRESGLKGLCGENDVRRVLQRAAAGDADAELALDIYCRRIRKYVGAYAAVLGRLDGLVFTAGVGENAAEIRRRVCEPLAGFGVTLDAAANAARSGEVRRIDAGGPVAVLIVPTDEETEIARQAWSVAGGDLAAADA